jgi:O-antigen/teichoic acid export membrane protein
VNRYTRLFKNSAVFAIGNLGSKLIQIFLVPLYTYALSTGAYGQVDILTTTVSLLLPVISLSVYDAILRFVMDKAENNNEVLTNALIITCIGAVIGFCIIPVFSLFHVKYVLLTYLVLIAQAFQSLFQQYARAIDKVKIFAATGIIGTVVVASTNVVFLLGLHLGVTGYMLSMLLAAIISAVFVFVTTRLYRHIDFRLTNKAIIKRLLIFSIPLIPNSLAWWVTTASSRYFVLFFVGITANGLLAVANKIPTLLTALNTIFFQAWQMSAIEEYNSKDKSNFFNSVFRNYVSFLFIGASGILLILRPFMSIFVQRNYYVSWKFVPLLLLAVVYSSFSTFLGTNYIAAKKTAGAFTTTIVGAGLNIALNFALVPSMGLYGVGLSSVFGYLAMWLTRVKDTEKYVSIKLPLRLLLLNHVITIIQATLLYTALPIVVILVVEFGLFLLVVLVNRQLIQPFIVIMQKRFLK